MRECITIEKKRVAAIMIVLMLLTGTFGSNVFLIQSYAFTATSGTVKNGPVRVRKAPVDGETITSLSTGTVVNVVDETTGSDGKTWYLVQFVYAKKTYEGYMRSDFIELSNGSNSGGIPDDAYVEELKAAGFPESYCASLLALHQKYPDWQFVAVMTGLDWADVIQNESVTGKNLVQSSVNDARKSTDPTAYNWSTNQWYGFDGAGWVSASPEYIAYCMDPRNFLNETYIFQFETLSYEQYQNTAGVGNILSNTFMSGNYTDTDGATRSYADTFVEIGSGIGVSPYHLASRCKQEQGAGTSPLISGTYSGYEGYYNHFNIGAYTTSAASSVVNGLEYAKKMGWNSIYKSLQGGSAVVADSYVKKGQNTIYFQKFNVVNSANLYAHQYMSNVMAAFTEGKSMGNAYTDKNAAFVFRIPVYQNMPASAVTFTDTGNPNNWLSELNIAGYSLTPSFQPQTTEYSLIVEDGVESITVNAKTVADSSAVTGTGSYSLNYGNNMIDITCISQSGGSRSYQINVVRQQAEGTPGEGSVTVPGGANISTSYALSDVLSGIAPGTSVNTVLSNITAENCTVKILKADGTENNGNVGTGDRVTLYVNGTVVKQYDIVIYGDMNGDGKISNVDLVMLQKQILGINQLEGVYALAADAGKDGRISNKDLVMLQKHILNISQISQ